MVPPMYECPPHVELSPLPAHCWTSSHSQASTYSLASDTHQFPALPRHDHPYPRRAMPFCHQMHCKLHTAMPGPRWSDGRWWCRSDRHRWCRSKSRVQLQKNSFGGGLTSEVWLLVKLFSVNRGFGWLNKDFSYCTRQGLCILKLDKGLDNSTWVWLALKS